MNRFAAALLVVAALAAGPAAACEIMPYDKRSVRIDAARLPADMIAAAAHVDVAVAEAVEPIDVDAWLDRAWAGELARADEAEKARIAKVRRSIEEPLYRQPGFGRIRFRTEATLKGTPQDSFTLTGLLGPADRPWFWPQDEAARRGDYRSPKAVYDYIPMVQGDMESGIDCNRGLSARAGGRYLIFRDADGNLLGEIRSREHRYGAARFRWPVYVPLGRDDPWLARVRKAVAKAR